MAKLFPGGSKKKLRIHQALARRIGTAILFGKHQPGDSLGTEIDLSAAFKVSRTAYREAMRILTAKGLVESRPKAGTQITPRSRWNLLDPDILAWMFSGKPDETFVRDLFELRGLIEPAAAAFAAERRTQKHVTEMHDALQEMRTYGLKTERGRAADQQFHRTLLEAAGNEPLASLASSVGAAVTWTTFFKQRHRTSPRDAIPDHERVLRAIEDGDSGRARREMEALLSEALVDMGYRAEKIARPSRARKKRASL